MSLGLNGAVWSVRPFVEAQTHRHEHRSRNKWSGERNAEPFRLRDKLASGGGERAAVLWSGGPEGGRGPERNKNAALSPLGNDGWFTGLV